MGKSYTPTFRLEYKDQGGWQTQFYDKRRPTDDQLRRYLIDLVHSFYIGGINEHVSKSIGYIPMPTQARVIRQKTGEIVAKFNAPMFMCWD